MERESEHRANFIFANVNSLLDGASNRASLNVKKLIIREGERERESLEYNQTRTRLRLRLNSRDHCLTSFSESPTLFHRHPRICGLLREGTLPPVKGKGSRVVGRPVVDEIASD